MVVGGRELIDTLWNVNIIGIATSCGISDELIDTLWNVNSVLLLYILYIFIINYICLFDYLFISS